MIKGNDSCREILTIDPPSSILERFSSAVQEVLLRNRVVLPNETSEKSLQVQGIIKEFIVDTLSNCSTFEIELFIAKYLSQGKLTRPTNILSNIITDATETYSFKGTFGRIIEQHWKQFYEDTSHRIMTPGSEEEKQKAVHQLLSSTRAEEIEIAYGKIQQACYPIEIVTELGLETQDLWPYAIDIVQAMQLIYTHRLHERYETAGQPTQNIFIVKWIGDKPAVLIMHKGKERRKYIINQFQENRPHTNIPQNSKLFLKIPHITR